VLTPLSAEGLDENNTDANFAIDSNSSTPWQTHYYLNNPVFGGLQNGSGLLLNMGRTVRLNSVTVTFGSIPGADVQIRIGTPAASVPSPSNDPDQPQSAADQAFANSMITVAQQNGIGGTVTFSVSSSASGQYVLIWFTKLPPMGSQPNAYQADIYNIVVRGSS
jgi:hypothetical protein